MKKIDKFEVKEIEDKVYLLNMIQKHDEHIVSHGLSFTKSELRELYIKLRDIFSN